LSARREVHEVLNHLLRMERKGLIAHIVDSTLHVTWASAEEDLVLRRIVAEVREHQQWLVELLTALKGGIEPARPDPRIAEIHFVDVHSVLPRIIAHEQDIIARYESALKRLAGEPSAQEVASRILARHREHASCLGEFLSRRTAA